MLRIVAVLINVTKRILLSPLIGGCVDCNRNVIQFVTADTHTHTVYSLSQRRTQNCSFAGPDVRVSLEHNTGWRKNKAFLNMTVQEEVMLCYVLQGYR